MISDAPQWLGAWLAARKGVSPAQSPLAMPAQTNESTRIGSKRGLAERSIANLTEPPPFTKAEANRLRSALAAINSAIDGGTWFSFGAALHDLKWIHSGTDYGFEIWLEWSSTSQGRGGGLGLFRGRADLEKRWANYGKDYQGPKAGLGTIFATAQRAGWGAVPVKEKVNGTEALHALPTAFVEACAAAPIAWVETDKAGRPKPTCRNARVALHQLGLDCEYDAFHDKLIVGGQAVDVWAGEVTDNAVHMLRVMIDRQFSFDPGTMNTRDAAIQECLQGRFDPVLDYIAGLQWDGTPRLRNWLTTYLGAADTPLNAALGGLTLIAAVRRARKPGCKYDQILVLEGPEGRGKSSAIEIMAGSENFSDQTILTLDDKGQQEALGGVWLYEIADLAGMSKADTEKVKAFCSRTTDRARPAYGRTRQDKPRRCVFFATTNHDTYLKSQTGNRRFGSVRTGHIELAALRRDRDQLWAEAAAAESRGVPLDLPEGLWGVAAEGQAARMDHDPWDDLIAGLESGFLKGKEKYRPDASGMEYRVSSRDIFDLVLRLPIERQVDVTAKRVAFIMRRHGWDGPKVFREADKIVRGYTKPIVTA